MAHEKLLNNEENLAWQCFTRGQATIHDAINRDDLENFGLALHEFSVLNLLYNDPKKQSRMSTLATKLVLSRSRLTHTVSRLETAGYVERFQCANDRRGIFCRLTTAGIRQVEECLPAHDAAIREHFLRKISPAELRTLEHICAKLIDDDATEARVCSKTMPVIP